MSEAGPSNRIMSEIESARPDSPDRLIEPAAGPSAAATVSVAAPALPVMVHPLVWAIQLWVVASIISLVLSAGLSRAMRGAYVGAESWITHIDHSAALTSQVAAICTTLLLVYMGMLSARASRSLLLGLGGALLGVAPTLIVFYAHRFAMPQIYTWVASVCGALALVVSAHQCRTKHKLRIAITLGGLTLGSAALHAGGLDGSGSPLFGAAGSLLQTLFAWCALAFAALMHLWFDKRRPLRAAILFGGTILLSATANAAAEPTIPRWILITGRAVGELSSAGAMTSDGGLGFSFALLLMVSTLLSRPGSLAQLVASILALCCVAPTAPLVVAWMTLCGYIAVVLCWVPDSPRKNSAGTAPSAASPTSAPLG